MPEIDLSQTYISNDGKGPYRARILEVDGRGGILLRRWKNSEHKGSVEFSLPVSFFLSDSCGWVIEKAGEGETDG